MSTIKLAGIQAACATDMSVVGFLGGTHTNLEWHKERIRNQKIPIAYSSLELVSMIEEWHIFTRRI